MNINQEKEKLEKRIFQNNVDNSIIKNDDIRLRFLESANWYIESAHKNRMYFYIFSVLEILLPGVILVLNSFSSGEFNITKVLISVFSVLSTFVAALMTIFQFHKKWINYRSILEELKTELSYYANNVGIYGVDSIEKDKAFIETIEKLMKAEHNDWIKIVKTEKYKNEKGK